MRYGVTIAIAALLGVGLISGRAASAAAGASAASTGAAAATWNQRAVSQIEATVRAHTPVFPDRTCTVTDPRYAGRIRQVTDGEGSSVQSVVWYYGDAINAAIADCHARGGGVVEVPASGSLNNGGVYYSGAITLLSNVNLRIDTGATVKFVRNPDNAFYPVVLTSYQGIDLYDYSPLVYALNQANIALTGGGTLDAQDNVGGGWTLPAGLAGAPSGTFTALSQLNAEGVPTQARIFTDDGHMPAAVPVLSGCPVQSRDWGPCAGVRDAPPPAGAIAYHSAFEPQFVEFNHSANVLVQGIHLVNTLFWEVHPLNSRNILVTGMTVNDTAHHTDDGVDPESCNDVIIAGSSITVLDDGIAIKSGRNRDGRERRAPSENILIKGDTFDNPNGGSASFSVGSEMSGGVYNVFAEDNTSGGNGTAFLLKLKTNSYRGGVIKGIYVRDSTITQTIRGVMNLDANYSESVPIQGADIYNPTIRDIYLDNVNTTPTVTTSFPAFVISGSVSRSPFTNIVYQNSVFYTTATFPAAFASPASRFFKHFVIGGVRFINPATGAVTTYDTTPLSLLGQTTASASDAPVPLTAVRAGGPDIITPLPASTFTISGRVNLAAYPGFLSGGSVAVYVDRNTIPVPLTVNQDGSFTSCPITLNNDEYWYAGRHYVAVSLSNGINLSTAVYQVSVPGTGGEPVPEAVGVLPRARAGRQHAQELACLTACGAACPSSAAGAWSLHTLRYVTPRPGGSR